MYTSLQLAQKFLRYCYTAYNSKGHGMHSPFVYDFIRNVLNNNAGYVPPPEIEQLRKALLHDPRTLQVEDLGAGSRVVKNKQRTVRELARSALKPKKYAQLLYRLAKHYQPQTILELGTSLGITTAYFAKSAPSAQIISIEGSEAIASVAKENFANLGSKNIAQKIGNFDVLLPGVVKEFSSVDLAFIDGNHRYEPTLDYFHQLLPTLHNGSILVFDDIHWSKDMENAWHQIQQHPSVKCTVDIFFLGFVFFRQEFKAKQYFFVRF